MAVAVPACLRLATALGVSLVVWARPQIAPIHDSAIDHYTKLAESGEARAQKTIGFLLLEGGTVTPQPAKAVRWLVEAANLPDTEAQVAVADIFREGRGVERNAQLAAHWYGQAAAVSSYATWRLGQLYEAGDGVPSDKTQAVQLYTRAAATGLAEAQNSLGNLYLAGIGVAADYQLARKWYARAAAGGCSDALLNMAGMYYFGLGVRQDFRRAHSLARSAAERHARDAEAFISEIERKIAETGNRR